MASLDGAIAAALGSTSRHSAPISGGCIHEAQRLDLADGRQIFVKSGTGKMADLLDAEARGISLLTPHIRVPRLLKDGVHGTTHWLAFEWLNMSPLSEKSWTDLGRQLAGLHSVKAPDHGLEGDNFIGTTPQRNRPSKRWSDFYITQRLRPQITLAHANGYTLPETQMIRLAEALLAEHEPTPALLHGDLWSGNMAALPNATSVVFDPAPYYGDPETDLAMMELFGGPLPPSFIEGYGEFSPDRIRRRPLYDLYHALNHLNLFGLGYESMVRRCLNLMRQN